MARYLAFDIGGTKIATGFVTLEPGASPRVEDVHTVPTEAVRGGASVIFGIKITLLLLDFLGVLWYN